MSIADSIRDWLEHGLQGVRDDLAAGRDISPARRFRLEGAIECWSRQQRMEEVELQRWLAANGVEAEVEHHQVRLQLVMRRAPVRPSTTD